MFDQAKLDALRIARDQWEETTLHRTLAFFLEIGAGGFLGTGHGQGATAILMAKILGHFDLSPLDPMGPERAHLEAEAGKLAYDARDRFVADPEAGPLRIAHMLADETAARLAALIDPGRALPEPAAASEAIHRETVYLTVVDADRMAVSLIYSTFHTFGSGLASARFGINFQNRGAGFSLAPGHPNEAGGGKRPMHTIIPAMLRRNDRLLMPFGVMGAAYQPAGHVRVMSNLLDFGMDPQAALDAAGEVSDLLVSVGVLCVWWAGSIPQCQESQHTGNEVDD